MADDDSNTFCDSDEEVFFGKVTEKELLKRALLGLSMDSTRIENFTPRAKAYIERRKLQDVLNGSKSEIVVSSTSTCEIESGKQCAGPSLNSSLNEDIIDLGSANNSVQIISDDESFLLNEKNFDSDFDIGKENVGLNEGLENLSVSSSKENNKFVNTIVIPETNIDTTATNKDPNCYLTCPTYHNNEEIKKFKDNTQETMKDTNGIAPNGIQNKSISGGVIDCVTDNENNHNDNISVTENSKQKSCLLKSEDDIVSSVDKYSAGYFVDIKKDSELTEITKPVSHDLTVDSSPKLEVPEFQKLQEICLDKQDISLNDTEYISINGISDSILNISHESSIISPAVSVPNKDTGSRLLANVIYEDISFDGEQPSNSVNQSTHILPKSSTQTDDLHMSVDEPDYHENLTVTDSVESHPSLFKSCFDGSNISSYHTANVTSENHISKPSSDFFDKYRETLNDTVGLEEIDAEIGVDIDNECKNDTSFEFVVQNRQSSFISSPPPSNVKITNKAEETKPKLVSKLPLFNHNAKSLIQPPKLNFAHGFLKSNNHKWAKNIQKLESKMTKSNKEGTDVTRGLNPKIRTPRKAMISQKCQQTNDNISGSKICQLSSNIPSINKTPAKTMTYQALRLVKSESKTPQGSSSSKNTLSTEKKMKSKLNPTFQEKNRYRNIVSPVQAYISGSPTVLQERKGVAEEIKHVFDSGNKKNTNSHLPLKIKTQLKGTDIVKKLKFEKIQGQENLNPNYSRDTLPSISLQNSEAVFMKEPEPPKKYLPKMGQKLQKLLDTPRPKLVVHQGRVKNSPDTKGVLLPCANVNSPEHNLDLPANRVSIRLVKNVDNTNELK